MESKIPEIECFNMKTISLSGTNSEIDAKRQEILDYFNNSADVYEELFSFISEEGFFIKAEPLRHPLIFYYGHSATFYINKLIISGNHISRINPKLESICASGVDEMSWDDLNSEHYLWPSVSEVREYRKKVRKVVENYIKTTKFTLPIDWDSKMWTILMGIEHERIHLETSSVIIRRLPLNYILKSGWRFCEEMKNKREDVLENYWVQINGTNVELGKTDNFFGWDVEYGKLPVQVQDFSTTKYLITNAEYYNFIKNGGYSKTEYWSEEGVKWLKFQTLNRPVFWNQTMDKLRLLTKEIDMPWDWPVEVNYLESKAYCNWLCNEKNTHVRLLSEAEWYILRGNFKEEEIKANINLDHFASSCPVDKFEHNFGVFDVVGNVWQWTETHVDAFPGFKVHPTYNDFSSPTFDNNHNIIKGGSWISTGNETIKSSRYAFRRHFYQHAGFRCVIGKPIAYSNIHSEQESDVIK